MNSEFLESLTISKLRNSLQNLQHTNNNDLDQVYKYDQTY